MQASQLPLVNWLILVKRKGILFGFRGFTELRSGGDVCVWFTGKSQSIYSHCTRLLSNVEGWPAISLRIVTGGFCFGNLQNVVRFSSVFQQLVLQGCIIST